ncbi:secretion-regulating guanine nucleotide exchange factor [Spea bombifrons]|uniref:secretion-regulating guanine nucleotide exchange factor n=1 Tax=Spea bombifrons TaxID=233779 RepID=UPI00234A765A|nr:secretion-regulating guanine nucleotide exchange factor [Spea bombifrons]
MSCGAEPGQRLLLCAWGANSYGQLGLGSRDDELSPKPLKDFPDREQDIRHITGGGGHSAAITGAGELYVCGQNKDGQLGLNHTDDVSCFTPCSAIRSLRVAKVACGWDFTIILTESGQVLSCGSNAFGQLGIPEAAMCSVPTPVQGLQEKGADIAAGLRHSLALTENGQTFQWGQGLASHAQRFARGKPVSSFLTAKEPCRLPGLEGVRGKRVIAGSYHSVLLTESGELYVWGSNKHGQLLQKETFVLQPQRVESHRFSREKIHSAWSGWTHMVVQTETGNVYSWGRSSYGQLGRKISVKDEDDQTQKDYMEPVASIPCLAGASQIACGSEHNLALCGNELYSWGWNEHGMCGNGSETDVSVPTAIRLPVSLDIQLIGCGAGHSMTLGRTSGQIV